VNPARNDPSQQLDGVTALGRCQPGHHLVEQQQRRLGGERARDLEPLLVCDRQSAPEPVSLVGQPGEREHLLRRIDRARARVGAAATRRS